MKKIYFRLFLVGYLFSALVGNFVVSQYGVPIYLLMLVVLFSTFSGYFFANSTETDHDSR